MNSLIHVFSINKISKYVLKKAMINYPFSSLSESDSLACNKRLLFFFLGCASEVESSPLFLLLFLSALFLFLFVMISAK